MQYNSFLEIQVHHLFSENIYSKNIIFQVAIALFEISYLHRHSMHFDKKIQWQKIQNHLLDAYFARPIYQLSILNVLRKLYYYIRCIAVLLVKMFYWFFHQHMSNSAQQIVMC